MLMNRRSFVQGSSAVVSAGAGDATHLVSAQRPQRTDRKYRLIATEEAFSTPEQIDQIRKVSALLYSNPDLEMWRGFLDPLPDAPPLLRRLLDLEGERLQIMDQAVIDMHLLSLTSPGVQMFDSDTATHIAMTANDRLIEMVEKHPTRFAGLASFAPQNPSAAAKEIDRAIPSSS